jgi:hypothetical protein
MKQLPLFILIILSSLISCKKEDEAHTKRKYPINISAPRAGEYFNKGSICTILWETDRAERLRIELYKENQPYKLISVAEPNNGRFDWLISHDVSPDTLYRFRLTSVNDESVFAFSHFFQITGDSARSFIKAPVFYYNNWIIGGDSIIRWQDNIEEDVRIDLFLNGAFLQNITPGTESNGSFNWSIPPISESSHYQFKITSTIHPDLYDLSDFFRISTAQNQNRVQNGNFVRTNYWSFSNPDVNPTSRWNINTNPNVEAAEAATLQAVGSIIQNLDIIPGQRYTVKYTLSRCNGFFGGTNSSSARIVCQLGDSTGVFRSHEGTFVDTITAGGTQLIFKIVPDYNSAPNIGFMAKLDNVEVLPVP